MVILLSLDAPVTTVVLPPCDWLRWWKCDNTVPPYKVHPLSLGSRLIPTTEDRGSLHGFSSCGTRSVSLCCFRFLKIRCWELPDERILNPTAKDRTCIPHFRARKGKRKALACPISASLPLQPLSFSNYGPSGISHPSIPHHQHTRQPLAVKSNETTPPLLLLYPSISNSDSGISVRLEQWDFWPCAVFLFPCSSLLLGSGVRLPQKVSTWCFSSTPIPCVCSIAWVTWFSLSRFAVEALKAIAEYWDLKSWNFTATDPCDGNAPWRAETANPRLACDCTIYPNNTCHVTHLWLLLLLVLIFISDWIPKLNCFVLEWQQGICVGCIGWNPGGTVPIDGADGLVSYWYICSVVWFFFFLFLEVISAFLMRLKHVMQEFRSECVEWTNTCRNWPTREDAIPVIVVVFFCTCCFFWNGCTIFCVLKMIFCLWNYSTGAWV